MIRLLLKSLSTCAILATLLLACGCKKQAESSYQAPNVSMSNMQSPVQDGKNTLLEKYNFGRESLRVSESVPSTAKPEIIDTDPGNLELERWVLMRTSKGDVKLKVHRDWAPYGARRFIELVQSGYYDDAPFFRVTEGIAQTGIAADPLIYGKYKDQSIPADPARGNNVRGTLSFVQQGPDNRNTQFFINLQDNPALDGATPAGYFVPFAEVMEGMNVLDSLFVTGEQDSKYIETLEARGVDFFRYRFPEGDIIEHMVMMD